MTPREAIQAGADYIGVGRPSHGMRSHVKPSSKILRRELPN